MRAEPKKKTHYIEKQPKKKYKNSILQKIGFFFYLPVNLQKKTTKPKKSTNRKKLKMT